MSSSMCRLRVMFVFLWLVLRWRWGEIKRGYHTLTKSKLLEMGSCRGQRSAVTLAGLCLFIHHSLRIQRGFWRKLSLPEAITSFLLLFQVAASFLFTAFARYEWYSWRLYRVAAFLSSTPASAELHPLATLPSAGRWENVRNSVIEAEYCKSGGSPSWPRQTLLHSTMLGVYALELWHVSVCLHLSRMWVGSCFLCPASTKR